LATSSSAILESPVRQFRRPGLLIILGILILIVLSIAIGNLSWLISGSHNTHNTFPTTPTRHHTSVVPTDTCISSHPRIPDMAHSQIAPCSSTTGPTPSTTITNSITSTTRSTSPTAT